jgi:hypothetical protein
LLAVSIHGSRERDIYVSWFAAAAAMAEEIHTSIISLRKTQDARNASQARLICQILAYPIASSWYRSLDSIGKHSHEEKRHRRITGITAVMKAIETHSDIAVGTFLNLDMQFNYEADREDVQQKAGGEKPASRYPALLISKLNEAVGFNDYIDWPKQKFPIRKEEELVFVQPGQPYGEGGYDLNGAIAIEFSIPTYTAEMFRAVSAVLKTTTH